MKLTINKFTRQKDMNYLHVNRFSQSCKNKQKKDQQLSTHMEMAVTIRKNKKHLNRIIIQNQSCHIYLQPRGILYPVFQCKVDRYSIMILLRLSTNLPTPSLFCPHTITIQNSVRKRIFILNYSLKSPYISYALLTVTSKLVTVKSTMFIFTRQKT